MISIGPYRPAALADTVHRFRESYRESLHSGRKCSSAFRLDQQVNVVALHREVDDAERASGAGGERPSNRFEDLRGAE